MTEQQAREALRSVLEELNRGRAAVGTAVRGLLLPTTLGLGLALGGTASCAAAPPPKKKDAARLEASVVDQGGLTDQAGADNQNGDGPMAVDAAGDGPMAVDAAGDAAVTDTAQGDTAKTDASVPDAQVTDKVPLVDVPCPPYMCPDS